MTADRHEARIWRACSTPGCSGEVELLEGDIAALSSLEGKVAARPVTGGPADASGMGGMVASMGASQGPGALRMAPSGGPVRLPPGGVDAPRQAPPAPAPGGRPPPAPAMRPSMDPAVLRQLLEEEQRARAVMQGRDTVVQDRRPMAPDAFRGTR
jgi:hypothetical protein